MSAGGIAFIVILALFTVAVFVGFVWLLCLAIRGSLKMKLAAKHVFLIVLAVGAVIRMAMAFSVRGLVGNINSNMAERMGFNGIVQMVDSLLGGGFGTFDAAYGDAAYYPLTMYIISFFGAIMSLFGTISIDSVATLILLKLPFIISDVLLAYFIFKITNKYMGENIALCIGGFVALCPVMMLGSLWPSVYSFLALILVVCMYFMLERKYILLTVAYTAALLISFEAIYLLPVIAVFLIYAYIKKIFAVRNGEKEETGKESRLLYTLPIAILACMAASYLLILPFALPSVGANPFLILYNYYLKPFNDFEFFTYNGLSLYTIFGKNGADLRLAFPVFVFSLLFAVAITVVTVIIYISKKNRANLVMLASYILLTLNVYFVNASELTLIPFFALTLIAFAIIKDRRMLQIVGIMSLFTFLNSACVLVRADYLTPGATYVPELLNGSYAVMSIIASAVALICHIYYTMVLLDIVMNGRTKKLMSEDDKFGSAMKGLIRIKD